MFQCARLFYSRETLHECRQSSLCAFKKSFTDSRKYVVSFDHIYIYIWKIRMELIVNNNMEQIKCSTKTLNDEQQVN